MSELRTVHPDGSVTVETIEPAIFATRTGREILDSWSRQADAWEIYCANKRREA